MQIYMAANEFRFIDTSPLPLRFNALLIYDRPKIKCARAFTDVSAKSEDPREVRSRVRTRVRYLGVTRAAAAATSVTFIMQI